MKYVITFVAFVVSASICVAFQSQERLGAEALRERGVSVTLALKDSEVFGKCYDIAGTLDGTEGNATIAFVDILVRSPSGVILTTVSLEKWMKGRRFRGVVISTSLLPYSELVLVDTFGNQTSASKSYSVSLRDLVGEDLNEKPETEKR